MNTPSSHREAILAAITESGGMTPKEVQERFGIVETTARHHLRLLYRAGLITTEHAANDPAKVWRTVVEVDLQAEPLDAVVSLDGTLLVMRGEHIALRLDPDEYKKFRDFILRSHPPASGVPGSLDEMFGRAA